MCAGMAGRRRSPHRAESYCRRRWRRSLGLGRHRGRHNGGGSWRSLRGGCLPFLGSELFCSTCVSFVHITQLYSRFHERVDNQYHARVKKHASQFWTDALNSPAQVRSVCCLRLSRPFLPCLYHVIRSSTDQMWVGIFSLPLAIQMLRC